MKELELSQFTQAGTDLLNEVRSEFQKIGVDDSKLPRNFSDDDDKLKLVFVGQYSSGKSSIIKMLTGEDVEIGAKITTQSATTYPWNGLEIIDTPGIDTKLRQDHDEITYNEINHAALLIFVITSEGFSQRLGDHFREFAIDQKRGSNMVLVVNKMDQTSQGNTPEQQKIIADDIQKVIQPFTPEQLYLSFLDTNSYFESLENSKYQSRLLKESGREIFVDNLNQFARSHEVLAKLLKPLYTIADQIRSAVGTSSAVIANQNVDDMKSVIEHQKNMMIRGKRRCLQDVEDVLQECRNEIIRQGQFMADSISSKLSEEDWQEIQSLVESRTRTAVETYSQKIQFTLQNSLQDTENQISTYAQSNAVKQITTNFSNGSSFSFLDSINLGTKAGIGITGLGMAISQLPAYFAIGTVTKAGQFAINATNFAGKVAEFFGYRGFTEIATKTTADLVTKAPSATARGAAFFTQNAAQIGKAVQALGAAVAVVSTIYGMQKESERARKINQARRNVMLEYETLADNICNNLRGKVYAFIQDNVDTAINACGDQIRQLYSSTQKSASDNQTLKKLLSKTEQMIESIQSAK